MKKNLLIFYIIIYINLIIVPEYSFSQDELQNNNIQKINLDDLSEYNKKRIVAIVSNNPIDPMVTALGSIVELNTPKNIEGKISQKHTTYLLLPKHFLFSFINKNPKDFVYITADKLTKSLVEDIKDKPTLSGSKYYYVPYKDMVLISNNKLKNNIDHLSIEAANKTEPSNLVQYKYLNCSLKLFPEDILNGHLKSLIKIPGIKMIFDNCEDSLKDQLQQFIGKIKDEEYNIIIHKSKTQKGVSGSPYIFKKDNNCFAIHTGGCPKKKNDEQYYSWGSLINGIDELQNSINTDEEIKNNKTVYKTKYHDIDDVKLLASYLKNDKLLEKVQAYLAIVRNEYYKVVFNINNLKLNFSQIFTQSREFSIDSLLGNYTLFRVNEKLNSSNNELFIHDLSNNEHNEYTEISLRQILNYEQKTGFYNITNAWENIKRNYKLSNNVIPEAIKFKTYLVLSDFNYTNTNMYLFIPSNMILSTENNIIFAKSNTNKNIILSYLYAQSDKQGKEIACKEYFRILTGGPTNSTSKFWLPSSSYLITANYLPTLNKNVTAFYRYDNDYLTKIYFESSLSTYTTLKPSQPGGILLSGLSIIPDNNKITMDIDTVTAYISLLLNFKSK